MPKGKRPALPPPPPQSLYESLTAWVQSEYSDRDKFQANLVGPPSPQPSSSHVLSGPCAAHARRDSRCNVLLADVQALLRAVGLFAGSIVIMKNFGDAFNV